MALNREFKTAIENGYQGTKVQFCKLKAINSLDFAELYCTCININLPYAEKDKFNKIEKIKKEIKKIQQKIQEIEI